MSNLYLDLLQLSLLVFSFTFLTIVLKNFFEVVRGVHLIVFCFGAVVSGVFFNGLLLKNPMIISVIYPFMVPAFYVMGPAMFLHSKRYTGGLRQADLWHYAPALLLLLDLVIYGLSFPEMYEKNMVHAMEGNFIKMEHSFIFSGTFLFTAYVVPTSAYALWTLIQLGRSGEWRRARGLMVLLVTIIVLTPFLEDVVRYFIWGDRFLSIVTLDQSRILLVLSAPALLFHVVAYVNFTVFAGKLYVSRLASKKSRGSLSKDYSNLQEWIDAEYEDVSSVLLSPGISKELYMDQTDFLREDWERFFKELGMSFNELKKAVRIHHSKRLIREGYLETHSVEGLTLEVGYRSRASFYKAFETETGTKLAIYRTKI